MNRLLLCMLLCTPSLTAFAQAPAQQPLPARIAAQNALFAEQWETSLRENPERATSVGDYRYNDRLGDYTPAHFAALNAENQAYLARLTAIDTSNFPEQDLLSHQLMERALRQNIENFGQIGRAHV